MRSIGLFFIAMLVFASACVPFGLPLGVSTSTPVPTLTLVKINTPVPATVTQTAPTLTNTATAYLTTLTPSPAAVTQPAGTTITPTELAYTNCGWMWATQDLPALSALLKQSYQDAGVTDIEVSASAYGENCLDQAGNVNHFAAMETDFYLTVPVGDINDTQALGNWIAKLVPVIGKLPKDQLAGPNPGKISIRFTGASDDANLNFPRMKAEELLNQGLSGSDLYNALKNNP